MTAGKIHQIAPLRSQDGNVGFRLLCVGRVHSGNASAAEVASLAWDLPSIRLASSPLTAALHDSCRIQVVGSGTARILAFGRV